MCKIKLKVCFKCHEYVPIIENDYVNQNQLKTFDSLHFGHPVQIVNEEEVMDREKWRNPFINIK